MNEIFNHPSYESTYRLLNCAFPEGISESEYWPLLAVLHQWISFRPIADILVGFTGKDFSYCLNDVMGFGMDPWPSNESIQHIVAKLRSCGYEEWLRESDCAFGSWQSVENILKGRTKGKTHGNEVSHVALTLLQRIQTFTEGTSLLPGVLYGVLFLATPNWHNRLQIEPVHNQDGSYRISRRHLSDEMTEQTVDESTMWAMLENFIVTATR